MSTQQGVDDADADAISDVGASFDRYARMVRRTLGVPIALVTIVEETRQFFLGAVGLPGAVEETRETPLSHSFCKHVVGDRRPVIVGDVREDARLASNPSIEEFGIIAYAGWPLTDHTGRVIGSLCALDTRVRRWTDYDVEGLADLAAACSAELAQRELQRLGRDELDHAEHLHQRSRVLLSLSERLSSTRTLLEVATAVERVGVEQLGCVRAGMWLREGLERRGEDPDGVRVEKLQFVATGSGSWPQALEFTLLPVEDGNPVGEVFRSGEGLFFDDRAAQDAHFAGRHHSIDPGAARAILPLTLAGHRLGVLVLVWPHEIDFRADDHATITAMMSYTAQAVARASLLDERVDVSATLQTAMLSELPTPDGLQLAARYRPASAREQVGGDWYDALELPSGWTTLVVGDVVGHDIEAAAVMGQLRSIGRAFAWAVDDQPAGCVERLDQALEPLGVPAMASLVLAMVGPPRPDGSRVLRWANAGHPPPLLLPPGGPPAWLDQDPDVMLGVEPATRRVTHEIALAPGTALLLFTDGLVERRGETISLGLDRLAEVVGDVAAGELEGLLDHTLRAFPERSDDVALLAVRVAPGGRG